MVTLDDVKSYLRIDGNDADDLLATLLRVAKAKTRQTIDDFDSKYQASDGRDFCKMADLCAVATVAELYEKRVGDGSQLQNYNYIVENMLEILQFYAGDDVENG